MRVRKHSRAGLFLIELMIAITFFAVTAAVFLQAFAKANSISRQAEELFQAQKLTASVAEILEGVGSAPVSAAGRKDSGADVQVGNLSEGENFFQELCKYFPRMESTGDGAYMYYDENWEACEDADGVYVLSVAWQRDGRMWNVIIAADENAGQEKNSGRTADSRQQTNSETTVESRSIYQLSLKLYCPAVEGGAS